jgi:hypothetical protein
VNAAQPEQGIAPSRVDAPRDRGFENRALATARVRV